MPAPSLMYEHGLNVPKGWFDEAVLDISAPISAAVTFDVPPGRVVHLNNAGEFEMGIGSTDMAIFLLYGSGSYCVSNPGTTARGNFMHQAIAPTGVTSGLVAEGSYEIETTEFDDTQDYEAGQLLTAAADNTDEDVGGVITNAGSGTGGVVEQFVDPVCGVVSRGRFITEHGVPVLAFWSTYLPGEFAA